MKKIPERRCIACNSSKPKKDLIRIVKPKEEDIILDLTGKKSGRGAYICKSLECLEKVKKTNKLSKVFETSINKEIYEDLRDVIVNRANEN